jgi:hypothetical protein
MLYTMLRLSEGDVAIRFQVFRNSSRRTTNHSSMGSRSTVAKGDGSKEQVVFDSDRLGPTINLLLDED